jgi:hypothetical protein
VPSISEPNGLRAAFDFPRSVSQRRAYRNCGMLYYLRYGQGYTSKHRKGTYAFGDAWQLVVQGVLQGKLLTPGEMYEAFLADWARYEQDTTLEWGSRTGWRFFHERARALAEVSFQELRRVIMLPSDAHYDERFTYELAPGLKETVIPDYVGPALRRLPNGSWTGPMVRTVVDWKTSDREYETVGVELDEQLTDYQVGCERHYGGPIEQVGLCVFVYQALPKVQWILRPRRPRDVTDQFVASAIVDDQRIKRNEFPRNPNACFFRGRCEMVPVCYESQRDKFADELVRPDRARNEQVLDWLSLDAIE